MSEGGEIKQIRITGGAITEGGKIKRTRKATTKKNKQEGGDPLSSPLTSQASQVQQVPTIVKTGSEYAINQPVQPCAIPQVSTTAPNIQDGGSKSIKVELKKRPTAKKVHLHPKKTDAPKTPLVKKTLTRKARKISLGISALHMKMKSAKKTHKKMKEMPLDKLKEELIKKKLIKATSKAPEGVLRQIAADAQVLEDKAL
jgi:hypothetical protein